MWGYLFNCTWNEIGKFTSKPRWHHVKKTAPRPRFVINLLVFFLFYTAAATITAFPAKDRIVSLSFCRSSPLRFYYEVDPDGPALKSPVKPLIRSGKIKPSRWDAFFLSTPTYRWGINTAMTKKELLNKLMLLLTEHKSCKREH